MNPACEGFECRRGRDVVDCRPTLAEALNICRALADRPSAVYLHNDSGNVLLIVTFDAEDPGVTPLRVKPDAPLMAPKAK